MSGELAPTLSSTTRLSVAIGATAFTTELHAVTKAGAFSTLTRRFTIWMPSCGSAWVSSTIISSFFPLTPPALLISATAHSAALTWSCPYSACEPVSGIARPKRNVSCAEAGLAIASAAATHAAAANKRLTPRLSSVMPGLPWVERLSCSNSLDRLQRVKRRIGTHHVRVFFRHVEQVDSMRYLAAVVHALVRHEDAEIVREAVDHSAAHAAARGATGDHQGVDAALDQIARERRAEERARMLLRQQHVVYLGRHLRD